MLITILSMGPEFMKTCAKGEEEKEEEVAKLKSAVKALDMDFKS